jgi:hypothetical protein
LLFKGESPWQALIGSVRLVLANAGSFAWFALLNILLFGLLFASGWTMVLVLLLGPWSTAASYAVWRDIGASSTPVGQTTDG